MRSWKIGAALLTVSFGVRAAFVIALGNGVHDVWTYHFAVTTFGFFMLGHLTCRAGQRWRPLSQPMLGVVLLLCSFATITFGGTYAGYDSVRFWGSVLFFAVALPGLPKAEAEALVAKAHQVCPYSNATRGNVDVRLTVV